ncbi:hypothetical protein AB0F15_06285 [Amycolatopsis sp. NPDC026612]|uniref:hypothetical protein n=1 Tax=Amycolatopsis sp. NPDC026612 TaxID=3155466 RepID=UPI0034022519
MRDVGAEDDLTGWEPADANWYRSGNSIIFGVMPGAEGSVECAVFDEQPEPALPVVLARQEISAPSRRLVVHDPNETVRFEFRVRAEVVALLLLVDDGDFASRVQIVSTSAG